MTDMQLYEKLSVLPSNLEARVSDFIIFSENEIREKRESIRKTHRCKGKGIDRNQRQF